MSSWNARVGLLFLTSGLACASTISFTTGMQVPESISTIPAGFGGLTGYLVTDPTSSSAADSPSTIWQVSPTGELTQFATNSNSLRDAIFLPATFGSYGGDYAVSGLIGNAVVGIDGNNPGGGVTFYNSSGVATSFVSGIDAGGLAIAPAGFGSIGGDLLVTYTSPGQAGIAVYDSSGDRLSDLVTEDTFLPYYMAFAPDSFGADAGGMFVTDDRQPYIYTVGTDGSLTLFATVPEGTNTRFIEFAPPSFGAWAGDMIVSVPGSSLSSDDGYLDVFNSSGQLVAQLTGLNPRGFTFIDGGTEMLLNITDPGIQLATPDDFTAVPEPGTFALAAMGLAAAGWKLRRSHRLAN
jgi:hypothetical protein